MYFFDSNRRITYFWRTKTSLEPDWLKERVGVLYVLEAKLNLKRRASLPSSFWGAYPGTIHQVVSPDNYMDFLL
jgi:hypothetical protein